MTVSWVLLNEHQGSYTHKTLEDTVKIREVVVACEVSHFLDGVMAGEKEHLGMHDTSPYDIVGRSETRVKAKETDETVLGETGLCSQVIKRRYTGKVTVDGPDGLADTNIAD